MGTSGLLAANVLLKGSVKVSAQHQGQQGRQKEGGRDTHPAHLSPAASWLGGHFPSNEVGAPQAGAVGHFSWYADGGQGRTTPSSEPLNPSLELSLNKPLSPHLATNLTPQNPQKENHCGFHSLMWIKT